MVQRKTVPRRVKKASLKKLSTQLFDYQIDLIKELSQKTGISQGIIYRYALDWFLIGFRETVKNKTSETPYPKELNRFTQKRFKQLAQIIAD